MVETQSPKISVNEKMLRWAIQRSGKSIDKLVEAQQMKNLEDWINGKKDPTVKQLEVFSTATSVPFGCLLFSEPPNEQIPMPHFRTLSGSLVASPSANLIDTIQIIEQRQEWMREYLIADGAEPLDFVGSAKLTDSHEATALRMRRELDIDQEWVSAHSNWNNALSAMHDKIEDAGIFLSANGVVGYNTHRPLDPEEFRGFALVDEYAPFIFVNNRDFKAAQMFTLAHELAHVWMGSSAAFDLRDLSPARDRVESACNKIAAEFLVPTDDLTRKWAKFVREHNPYQAGAHHFKVSEVVIARRALDTQLINQEEFRELYQRQQQEAKAKKKDGSGGEFYNTADTRIGKTFLRNVIGAVREGRLLYSEAYSLTGLGRKTFDGMMDHIKEKRT